ncbi:MAG TPA: hypothetical protein VFQ63_02485, partial [Patescibacteria group bacterium]|nr:hypothetical protein [Patescibacteria group bacterium]
MSIESHQKREIEGQEQAISSTRVEQVFLLGRTPAETVFLENFITHPTEYNGLKPPKWLEKGTHTQWDTDTRNGTLTAHHDSFPITAVGTEEELAHYLSETGMQPHQVLVVTSSETPTEIILSKKKLSPQDSLLAEKGYQVATVGGMKKTGDQRFDSFRKAWGFLIGQTTYFLDATPKPTEEESSEGFLSGAWFAERKINHKPRFVAGTDGTTHTIEDFEFFYKPDETTIHRINAIIERARQTGERPVLYIPTCPPDTYYY